MDGFTANQAIHDAIVAAPGNSVLTRRFRASTNSSVLAHDGLRSPGVLFCHNVRHSSA